MNGTTGMDPIDYLRSQAPNPDDVGRATLDELDARVAQRTGLALRRRPVVARAAARFLGATATVALAVVGGVALWPDDPDPVVEFGSGDVLVDALATTAAAHPEPPDGIGFLRYEVLSGPFSPAAQATGRQIEDTWVDERGGRLLRTRPVGTDPGDAQEEVFSEAGMAGHRPPLAEMQTWPHEPETLLRELEALREERLIDSQEAAINHAFLLLAEPTTPPELRAALIELLAARPGAIVRPSADDAVQISVTGPERTATGTFDLATARLVSFEEIAEAPEPLVGADTGDVLVRYEYLDAEIVDEMGELP